jgi:hypothetical protein
MFQDAVYIATCVCHDALAANNTTPKSAEAFIISSQESSGPVHVFLDVECCVHQMGLIRTVVCLFQDGYWSHLVRLAHLFESSSFRQKIRQAIFLVILEDSSEANFWPSLDLPHDVK